MFTGLLHLHSTLRYVILILILISIFQALSAGNKPYTATNKKINLFTLIGAHLQLVVGLVLYFMSPLVNFSQMSNPINRYWNVEHISMMLVSIVLITVGYSKSKKALEAKAKHRAIYIYYGIAVVVILVGILTMKDRNAWAV
ncbi:cytochrome B [Pelobium manganitolerans]|uniref:Cytochrome B n=1 Tax=Pelobium manganitolerans TaxID=1842495 RepID=A0A419SC27_9SPHI|nr:cytochrome B [Pelobium manganitolerans]RKD20220.1 cytochrome B [Pelobium manganitolerans]